MTGRLRIGMLGCGAISAKYLSTLARLPELQLVACADLVRSKAEAVARDWPEPVEVLEPAELFRSAAVDVVLNLTVPAAHATTSLAAIRHGKHVYLEKPLATTAEKAMALVSAARSHGVRLACAPDTVLGTGIQTARAAIADGLIGRPTAANAMLLGGGPDNRHPNPHFFYQPGAGPLMDMGPYYVTALVTLLGPIERVSALGHRSSSTRPITDGPNVGGSIDVAVDTHVSASLLHADGALSTLVTSFDAPAASRMPRIEIYGTAGSLGVPDPNQFSGPVVIKTVRAPEWETVPESGGYVDGARGIGLADLAAAIDGGFEHRASSELAAHVVEVLEAIQRSSSSGQAVDVSYRPEPPTAVPLTALFSERVTA